MYASWPLLGRNATFCQSLTYYTFLNIHMICQYAAAAKFMEFQSHLNPITFLWSVAATIMPGFG